MGTKGCKPFGSELTDKARRLFAYMQDRQCRVDYQTTVASGALHSFPARPVGQTIAGRVRGLAEIGLNDASDKFHKICSMENSIQLEG